MRSTATCQSPCSSFLRLLGWTLFAWVGLWAPSAAAQVTYLYEGQPFTAADPPYTTNDRIQGSVRLPAPLAPGLVDIPLDSSVLDFELSDGVRAWTAFDAAICNFTVSTDGAGAITAWSLSLRGLPLPAPGDPQAFLDSSDFGDQAGGAPATMDLCGTLSGTFSATTPNAGAWTLQGTPGAPLTYDYLGQPYDTVSPPFMAGDRVSGSLTLTQALPVYLPSTDVTPFVIAYSFDDGERAWTPGDSVPCRLSVSTDGRGGIAGWTVALRELPLPALGDPQRFLDSTDSLDAVGVGPAGTTPCDNFSALSSSQSSTPGAWTDPLPPGTPTPYDYTGAPFVVSTGPWSVGDSVTGNILLDDRLPRDLPLTEIRLGLLDFQFLDGFRTWLPTNSEICRFSVATDGFGRIVDWRISLRELPLPAPGDPQLAFDSSGSQDQVATISAAPNPCEFTIPLNSANSDQPGRWFGDSGSVADIPTLSQTGLALLGLLLATGGAGLLRRRSGRTGRRAS